MKPIDLVARINETIAQETSGSPCGYGEQELTPQELGNLKLEVARVFNLALAEMHVGAVGRIPVTEQL